MAWTAPRDWTAGELVTEAMMDTHIKDNLNYLNDLRVKYAQVTADVTGIAGTETDIITAPAFTPISSSRLLRISFRCRSTIAGTSTGVFTFRLKEGSTTLNEINNRLGSTSTSGEFVTTWTYVASPSAASHTYKATAQRATGTGTMDIQASSTAPMQIIVEDIGAA